MCADSNMQMGSPLLTPEKTQLFKVLLMRPPFSIFKQGLEKRVGLPLGIFSIASVLEKNDIPVAIFDSLVYDDHRNPDMWGASWERLEYVLNKEAPDIVGITNQFSQQRHNAVEAARRIKRWNPLVKVVIGGSHASADPEDFLIKGFFDIAVIGEGEETILNIVRLYQGKIKREDIPGIAWVQEGILHSNPPKRIENLDELPFPAYHLVDLERYFDLSIKGIGTRPSDPFDRSRRDISLVTSRGCPFQCVFCSIHKAMGNGWRANSADYVLRHIQYLVNDYHVEMIHFEDDNLTLNRQRFEKILQGIISLPIEWDAPNGIRADTLDNPILSLMKRAHVREVRIAIESGSQRVLDDVIHKHLNLSRAIEICRGCYTLDLPCSSFYVVGLPGETRREMKETLDLAYQLMNTYGVFPHVNVANPLPGTPLLDICRRKGYLIDNNPQIDSLPYHGKIETEEFSSREIESAFKLFHRKLAFLYGWHFFKRPAWAIRKLYNLATHPHMTLDLLAAVFQLAK